MDSPDLHVTAIQIFLHEGWEIWTNHKDRSFLNCSFPNSFLYHSHKPTFLIRWHRQPGNITTVLICRKRGFLHKILSSSIRKLPTFAVFMSVYKYLVCLLALGKVYYGFSQNEANVWKFGANAGLNFNTATPTPISGASNVVDCSSAISDINGNLLFYTNGGTVWNRNDVVMPNGSGLISHLSAGQCGLIMPIPSSNKYVVFSNTEYSSPGQLHYSVVDMSLNSGFGDVIPTQKNISLGTGWTEKQCAIYNCNGNYYWVLMHKWNSSDFVAIKVDASGVTTTSVTSSIGSVHNCGTYSGTHDAMGQLTISRDGTKVINALTCQDKFELFDFNIATGVLSNAITIPGNGGNAWGTGFSADSKKLYVNSIFGSSIYQYDLSIYNASSIISSKTTIYNTGTGGYNFGYMELGPDNKMYIARPNSSFLSVVNSPNSPGSSSGFSYAGISLSPGASLWGISRIAYNINAGTQLSASVPSATICAGQTATLTAGAASGYTWSPSGSNSSTIAVQPLTSSVYTVSLSNGSCISSATTNVTVLASPVLSVTSQTTCTNQIATLTATGASSYVWQPSGATGPVFSAQPLASTSYTVTGSNGYCTSSAVASVSVIPAPVISASSVTICAGAAAILTASSTSGYTWSPSGATTATISVQPFTTTVYTVSASNGNCTAIATPTVFVISAPVVSVAGASVCPGQTATLTASGASSYTWQPSGQTTSVISVQPASTAIYTVSGSNGLCTSTSTVNVTLVPTPVIVAASASVCAGYPVVLQAAGASTYTWNPVSQYTQSISVQPSATTAYTVTGSNGVCISSAIATVTVAPSPTLSVSSATVCAGQTAILTASSTSGYTWSPSGANTPTIAVQPAGSVVYTVSSSNSNCLSVAQASVTVLPSPTVSIISPTVCSGQVSSLTASGATSYTWMPQNLSTPSVTVQLASATSYTVTGSNGACESSTVIPVAVAALPQITVNSATICAGESRQLSANGALSYTWQPATGLTNAYSHTIEVNPLSSTDYTVSGNSALGCPAFAIATVSVIPLPSLTVTPSSSTICSGSSATLTATGGAAGSYTWTSFPPDISGNATPLVVNPSVTTVYALTATNGLLPYLCSSTKSVTIQVLQRVNAATGYADPVCLGSSTMLSATGGKVYHWQPSTGLNRPNDSVTKVTPLSTTIYTVTVSGNGFCPGTATVEVQVNPVPEVYAGRDTIINMDEYTVLAGSGDVEVGFVSPDNKPLACNFCSQVTVYPKETTCYLLKGTNTYGCTGTDTVCVMVTKDWDVFVPNAFTPNGDGYNDVFIPSGYGLAEIHLTIFDRWGNLIFRSHGEVIGWDGKRKGQLCKQDVYVYQAEIVTMAGNTVKRTGHVTLLP